MNTSEEVLSWLTGLMLGLLVVAIAGSGVFFNLFQDRIYPDVIIDGVQVGGLTRAEAEVLLRKNENDLPSYELTLAVDDIQISSNSADLGLRRDYQISLNQAYELGRVGFPLERLWMLGKNLVRPTRLSTPLAYEETALVNMVNQLKQRVDLVGENPSASLRYSGYPYSLTVFPGEPGREVIFDQALAQLKESIGQEAELTAPVASTSTVLNTDEITDAEERASNYVGKRLILRNEDVRLEVNDQDMISWLTFPDGTDSNLISTEVATWKEVVDREAQNAEFSYDSETLEIETFLPDKPGFSLNELRVKQLLKEQMALIETDQTAGEETGLDEGIDIELELPVEKVDADITLAETNDLGINQLIGFGESEYDHSIPNRIHNVAITAERINHTLVAPGDEFSFNRTLGEVSAATGFRTAYVIKSGRTELGDGGGVCQVSTTLFRSVLDAGLDITLRLPHSYRVSYYELNAKPGIDATVYAGNVDFRFINDTPNYILINTETDSDNLYMKVEIYGTDDGRSTEITDHEVWGYTPPLPTEYYPDPTLPAGTRKQIDWAVGGAKAKFTHIIRDAAGNITHEQTYYSNYQPWAAKYLVGE